MLDEQDLLAIAQLIDQKLAQQKEEILKESTHRMQVLLDAEIKPQFNLLKEEILKESTHRMQVLLDAEIKPQFNLLAEDIGIIREKMMPDSRIERIEDDVWALKASVRRINQDLRELKQAQ